MPVLTEWRDSRGIIMARESLVTTLRKVTSHKHVSVSVYVYIYISISGLFARVYVLFYNPKTCHVPSSERGLVHLYCTMCMCVHVHVHLSKLDMRGTDVHVQRPERIRRQSGS
jgi:hypothetical protein